MADKSEQKAENSLSAVSDTCAALKEGANTVVPPGTPAFSPGMTGAGPKEPKTNAKAAIEEYLASINRPKKEEKLTKQRPPIAKRKTMGDWLKEKRATADQEGRSTTSDELRRANILLPTVAVHAATTPSGDAAAPSTGIRPLRAALPKHPRLMKTKT